MPRTVGVVLAQEGAGHLTEGLLTLHNLMGDAGINVKQNKIKNTNIVRYLLGLQVFCLRKARWCI